MRHVVRATVSSLIICSSFALVAHTPAFGRAAPVPDFSGQWGRAGLFRFEPPQSGPGPVTNTSRFPDTVERVGDYTNPILTPHSAEIVKKRGDLQLAGANFPDPRNQCRPEPPNHAGSSAGHWTLWAGPTDRKDLLGGDRETGRNARAMVDQVDGHLAEEAIVGIKRDVDESAFR